MGDDVIEWLAEIETEAAPGPWRVAHHGTVEVEDRHGSLVADFGTIACEGDARLVAALRTAAPELLAVVRTAEDVTYAGDTLAHRQRLARALDALRARLAEVRGG